MILKLCSSDRWARWPLPRTHHSCNLGFRVKQIKNLNFPEKQISTLQKNDLLIDTLKAQIAIYLLLHSLHSVPRMFILLKCSLIFYHFKPSTNFFRIAFSSSVVLFLPIMIETERMGIEEAQKQQQRQILLGPGAAMSAGANAPLPAMRWFCVRLLLSESVENQRRKWWNSFASVKNIPNNYFWESNKSLIVSARCLPGDCFNVFCWQDKMQADAHDWLRARKLGLESLFCFLSPLVDYRINSETSVRRFLRAKRHKRVEEVNPNYLMTLVLIQFYQTEKVIKLFYINIDSFKHVSIWSLSHCTVIMYVNP